MDFAMYGPFDFARMNETDVREQILVDLLRVLGYRHSSPNDIITEQSLRYPALALGRKKKTDPKLRGKADYILEVEKRLRWVIEVKSPAAPLTDDDRDQAWSYAIHPEVKALFYLVTNGRAFELFRAGEGPGTGPVLAFTHEELRDNLRIVANVLSPESLKRDFPTYVLDVGLPLAPGLRSFAKVNNGWLTYTACRPQLPRTPLVGLKVHFSGGSMERTEGGRIALFLRVSSPYQQIDDFLRSMRFDVFEMESDGDVLSTDLNSPTVLRAVLDYQMPAGSRLFDISSGSPVVLSFEMHVLSRAVACGYFENGKFKGKMWCEMQIPEVPQVNLEGEFEVELS
jgi:hypothetical protein